VERHLEEVLATGCGFDVPSIIFSPAELRQVYDDARHIPPPPFANEASRRYVIFFKAAAAPGPEVAAEIAAWRAPGEAAVAIGRAVHVWIAGPMLDATFFGAFKKPLAPGTNRDLKVVATLAERWGG
jgi:uncharacterized protein (DUF1697 family)